MEPTWSTKKMESPADCGAVDASLSQSTQSSREIGDTTSTTIEGDESTLDSVEESSTRVAEVDDEETPIKRNSHDYHDNAGGLGDDCGDSMEVSEGADVQKGEGVGEREEKENVAEGPSSGEVPLPSKLQRFYFESDTLALKNNPE